MEIIGIIAEYNPFHNGHIYHLNKIKEMYPDSLVVLVMSSSFTQRGLPSIINKWDKTEIALNHGIDIVVELPFPFSTQSADIFASASIKILNNLGVTHLVFGSEENDIDKLYKLADIQLNNSSYNNIVKKYLDNGYNYPTSLSKALSDISNNTVTSSNDLLGLSYVKEIIRQNANIKPITIQRTNDYLSDKLDGDIASATGIRNAILNNKDISSFVPCDILDKLNNNLSFLDNYFNILKYKINTSRDLNVYLDVDEGIENRIIKYINKVDNIYELIECIKTKRYTYNKIQRMLIHILCDFTKEDKFKYSNPQYIRIMGFNKNGQSYLNKIKKTSKLDIITKFSDKYDMLLLEKKITEIYASCFDIDYQNKLIESEYKNKPLIKP